MAIPNEYRDICQMLLKSTNEGRVIWVQQAGTMTVELPDFGLQIWAGKDVVDNEEFVAMALLDAQGEIIDSWYVEEGESDFEMMKGLFTSARRGTPAVADKIQKLRDLLKSEAPLGTRTSQILVIESALYGAGEKTVDVAPILRQNIRSGRIKGLSVSNRSLGGDPVPGAQKTLSVKYSYMGQSRSASFPEGGIVSLPE